MCKTTQAKAIWAKFATSLCTLNLRYGNIVPNQARTRIGLDFFLHFSFSSLILSSFRHYGSQGTTHILAVTNSRLNGRICCVILYISILEQVDRRHGKAGALLSCENKNNTIKRPCNHDQGQTFATFLYSDGLFLRAFSSFCPQQRAT